MHQQVRQDLSVFWQKVLIKEVLRLSLIMHANNVIAKLQDCSYYHIFNQDEKSN